MSDVALAEIPKTQTIVVNDEAYKVYPGPILLLAGPGTGKTYQLAKRIQFLTEDLGVNPEEITVITFTREAAQSMRDKLSQKNKAEYVPQERRPKRILTMHSLAQTIIADDLSLVGLQENFELVESERLKEILMLDAASLLGLTEDQARIALADRACAKKDCSKESKAIITKYEEILRKSNALDYDDQILLACELLNHKAIRDKWQQNTKHLLVDEYQDINEDQFQLIKLLTVDQLEGLFVVGDDDQSIYKFRGGSPTYIRKFSEHFAPSAQILQLETSRRCLKNILDCANRLVTMHDAERLKKADPKYHKTEEGSVFVHDCPSDDREAKIVCSIIKDDIENANTFRSIFILTLTKHYAKKIEEMLGRYGLSFDGLKASSDSITKFLDFQSWANKTDSNVLLRQAIQLILDGGSTPVPGPKVRKVAKVTQRRKYLAEVAKLWEIVLSSNDTLWKALNDRAGSNAVFADIVNKLNLLRVSYENDLGNFLKQMVDYVKPWATKAGFYQELTTFLRTKRASGGQYQIRLLSLQASKGLEADLVFVLGLEEGSIPRGKTADEIAEDARLIFVAMTRAREQLHLTHCRKRDGSSTFKKQSHSLKASSFVTSLPKSNVNPKYHKAK